MISCDEHYTDLRYAFRDMLVTVISIATYLFDLVSQTFSILEVRDANSPAIFILWGFGDSKNGNLSFLRDQGN